MQDKIEVGEYIRTKNGYIRQVVKRDIDKHILLDIGFEGARYLTKVEEKEDIVKHSKNIIKLIEEGDYVNGMLVTEIGKMHKVINICFYNGLYANNLTLVENDIKSIVTKEQFQSMEYKVGE